MMHFYTSGSPSKATSRFIEQECSRSPYRLFSMHGNYMNAVIKRIEQCKKYGYTYNTVLLDSGAYTAWNKGHKTTVDDVIHAYSRFIETADGMFDKIWAINLDVIPGTRGKEPTKEEVDQAVAESDVNLKILQDKFGDMILPVFHQGESEDRLHVVQEQAKYICLSPRQGITEEARVSWCTRVNNKVRGKNPTHGLATTGMGMLSMEWFSVDSATSAYRAVVGAVIICMDRKLFTIYISEESPNRKKKDWHLDTLDPNNYARIINIIANDIFTVEELATQTNARYLFNITQLNNYANTSIKYSIDQPTLFGI